MNVQGKVSAYAVELSNKGKVKLDVVTKKALAEQVKKLHENERFNKVLLEASDRYKRNSFKRLEKKKKRRQATRGLNNKVSAREIPLTPAQASQASKAPTPNDQIPLNGTTCPPRSPLKVVCASDSGRPAPFLVVDSPFAVMNGELCGSGGAKTQLKLQPRKVQIIQWRHPDDLANAAPTLGTDEMLKQTKLSDDELIKGSVVLDASEKCKLSKSGSQRHKTSNKNIRLKKSKHAVRSSRDADKKARLLFRRLLAPVNTRTFFTNIWTKKPLHVQRNNTHYYEKHNWFSTSELDRILREESLRFGVNIDLTTYRNGKRETHNPSGRAYPAIVWDSFQGGCSVRLLNPQTYSRRVWYLLTTLQNVFGCMVGANVYLTPAGTQGFAPHYDDIDAFVLQLEGTKHWRIYGPRTSADVWPLTSSANLRQEELGEPIVDCILQPGDLLYFPRGAIHQAMAQENVHSLHITVSTHQKHTWSELLAIMVEGAIANATENDVDFRESLPIDYLDYTGVAFQEQGGAKRNAFLLRAKALMEKLISFAPVDAACDLMAKRFIHDSLPPYLSPVEKCLTINGQGERWSEKKRAVTRAAELEPDTSVRLVRKHCLRIVCEPREPKESSREHDIDTNLDKMSDNEDDTESDSGDSTSVVKIYYSTDNDRLYHGNTPQFFVTTPEEAAVVEFLQLSYPDYVSVEELPLSDVNGKLIIARELYEKGLLMTEESLRPLDL